MSEVRDHICDQYGYEVAERAAIYEYEAGMTREAAEEKAVSGPAVAGTLDRPCSAVGDA